MTKLTRYQLLSVLFFLGVLVMNYLATALPLGGNTTGELSDKYPNLFTPAGFTFSIWGVIYLALLVYVGFQASSFFKRTTVPAAEVTTDITPWFLVSCVCNMLWIVLWHYQFVFFSVLVMLGILWSLIQVVSRIHRHEQLDKLPNKLFFKLPFGLYLGWILVATVANVTAFLVGINWDGLGLSEPVWTVIMLVTATGITIFTASRFQNVFVGFSVIWALFGIVSKRFDRLDIEPYVLLPYLGIAAMLVIATSLVFVLRRG